jgi:hypothetical protein
MTTIDISKQKEESWTFIYSFYASALAVVPLVLHFIDMAWPYKIAVFYVAFLAISYGSLLSEKGRTTLNTVKSKYFKFS